MEKSKRNIIVAVFTVLIVITTTAIILLAHNANTSDIDIYKHFFNNGTFYLDLDNDNNMDKFIINNQNMLINDKEFLMNEHYSNDTDDRVPNNNFSENKYYIVDLNNDGCLDIIHKTSNTLISPITNLYTIYNYKDNNIKKIGEITINGLLPGSINVSKNTIKFSYHPYETKDGYMKEVEVKLDI